LEKSKLIATGHKNPLLKEVRKVVNDEVLEGKNKALNGKHSLNSLGYVYTKFAFIASRDYWNKLLNFKMISLFGGLENRLVLDVFETE
jgi:hypothetical protein